MSESSGDFPLWIVPVIPVFFVLLWCGVCFLLAVVSGWRRLAGHYAASAPTTGQHFLFRSGMMGPVSYRNALHLAVAAEGLFVWALLPMRLGSPRLFIPWSDITAAVERTWLIDYAVLTFARAPRVRLRLRAGVAREVAAASRGALQIGLQPQ